MRKFQFEEILYLAPSTHSPNISLYANNQDEFRVNANEVRRLLLRYKSHGNSVLEVLQKTYEIENVIIDGVFSFPLALFMNQSTHVLLELPVELNSIGVVAQSFHLKPLLKWKQREQPFLLAHIDKKTACLFEGSISKFALKDTLQLSNYHTRSELWSAIDQHLEALESHSFKPPIILSGLQNYVTNYKKASKHGSILQESIESDMDSIHSLDDGDLHRASLQILEPYLEQKDTNDIKKYLRAKKEGKTQEKIEVLISKASQGQVKHLYVSEDIELWGKLNARSEFITFTTQQKSIYDDDLLDDLAELVLKSGGRVTVLPRNRMPTMSSCCGIIEQAKKANKNLTQLLAPRDNSIELLSQSLPSN
jgi:hypothetical protein